MITSQLKDSGTRVVGILSNGKPCLRCYHFGIFCTLCTKYNNSKITICTWKMFSSRNGWFSLTYKQYINKCNKNSSIITIYDESDESTGEQEDSECSEQEDGKCSEQEDGKWSEQEDGKWNNL